MEAKKAGKIRYIGFTGHKDPAVHLRMLEVAAQHKFHFDTAQMPLNILDASFRSFAHQVVPKLVEQGIGVLGMKPLASGAIPQERDRHGDRVPALRAQPADFGRDQRVRQHGAARPGVRGGAHIQAADPAQISALMSKTRDAAMSGKFELFKTSVRFDGTAQHPEWMG